jgi:hypothetical protein
MFEFWISRDTSGIFMSPTVRINYESAFAAYSAG